MISTALDGEKAVGVSMHGEIQMRPIEERAGEALDRAEGTGSHAYCSCTSHQLGVTATAPARLTLGWVKLTGQVKVVFTRKGISEFQGGGAGLNPTPC